MQRLRVAHSTQSISKNAESLCVKLFTTLNHIHIYSIKQNIQTIHFAPLWQPLKKLSILNPCYQRVKKNTQKNIKKRLEKPCENKKDSYFCTRIRAEVHTQTEN